MITGQLIGLGVLAISAIVPLLAARVILGAIVALLPKTIAKAE